MKVPAFLLLWLLVSYSMLAQDDKNRHIVRASAEATVMAEPNQAHISIGVRTQATTARASAEQNSAKTTAVIRSIRALMLSKGQVQTSNYSIAPYFENVNNNSRQAGFETTNTVDVTVDDLSLLPSLIDASTATGANSIGGISFGLKDDSALRMQALADAGKQARAAAEAIAVALGLHVTGVVSAESTSGGGTVRPVMQAMAFRAMKTPIEAGQLSVQASVTVTLEVAP